MVKLSTKWRVTRPKSTRQRRHWEAGTRLVVEETADGVLLKSAPLFKTTGPEDIFGSLKHSGRAKTLKEMDAGVPTEARRRDVRNWYEYRVRYLMGD